MKIQLLSCEDHAQYLLEDRQEIVRVLRGIQLARTMVGIYSDPVRDPALSSIVAVDAAKNELILERGPSALTESGLLASQEVTCVAIFEQVHIQFTARRPRAIQHDGIPCIRLDFPSQMLRMQRREYYRLTTSVIHPVKCMVNTEQGFVETTVVDISVGGLGVLAFGEGPRFQAGDIYHGCRIALPKAGEYAVSLEVCSTYELTLKNGNLSHRAGCRFIDLPPSVETEIQRYIIRMERERRTRYT
ncbi:MAG: flagellar brake protein [Betaproteobacteria bacterium]|nr:flagellar brake protein [Betaproteobacteria bacterium]